MTVRRLRTFVIAAAVVIAGIAAAALPMREPPVRQNWRPDAGGERGS